MPVATLVEEPRTAAPLSRNQLIEQTVGLVHALAAQILRTHHLPIAREDLISCGLRGLVQAADSFDHRPGVRFSTFAYRRIRGAMFDALEEGEGVYSRSELRHRMKPVADPTMLADNDALWTGLGISRGGSVREDFDDQRPEISSRAPGEPDLIAALDSQRVRVAVATLPPSERQIIEMLYYGRDHSFETVARALGVKRPCIFRKHARALVSLRAKFSPTEGSPNIMQSSAREGLLRGECNGPTRSNPRKI